MINTPSRHFLMIKKKSRHFLIIHVLSCGLVDYCFVVVLGLLSPILVQSYNLHFLYVFCFSLGGPVPDGVIIMTSLIYFIFLINPLYQLLFFDQKLYQFRMVNFLYFKLRSFLDKI